MASFQVTIRSAERSDVEAMTALIAELFELEEDFQADADRQHTALGLLLESNRAIVLVAEIESKTVGMCSGQILISTAEGGPALLVEDVVVQQEFKRQGIGKKLLESLADAASKKGISRLQLLADRNNSAALNFYSTTGWHTTELIALRRRIA